MPAAALRVGIVTCNTPIASAPPIGGIPGKPGIPGIPPMPAGIPGIMPDFLMASKFAICT